MRLTTILDPRGRTGPREFLLAGIVLFGTKFAIDNLVARGLFGRQWSLIEYLAFGQAIASLVSDRAGRLFYLTMTAVALPYAVVGLVLTFRRLRDAGLPTWLVALFFVPLGNVMFFLSLCLVPSRRGVGAAVDVEPPGEEIPMAGRAVPLEYGREVDASLFGGWGVLKWWPAGTAASGWLAALLPVPVMLVLLLLSTHVLRDYGWGLFIGLPFVNGMLSALLHGSAVPRRVGQSLGAGALGVTVSAVAIFAFALEGIGCLIMFLPLAIPVGLIGAALGHAIQARPDPRVETWRVGCLTVVLLAAWMPAERASSPAAPRYAVTTVVEVDAPPAEVWRHVVSFPELPPPTEWMFRAGVAYPVRARIEGSGVGAVRYCEFSTGAFVEPIEAWEPGRLLKFAVTHNPPAIREWTFYPAVHPPHVDGFLRSDGGEFRLVPLSGGRTRLEGTTWYRHHLWPAGYWRLWSDTIIHRIHGRVLGHVKQLAEASRTSPAIELSP